jgi:glycosyltransferase involved in cell wall biosynthesis
MHVLQLGPYPPPEGGINRNILAIRAALQERGDRCSIIATSRSTHITAEPDVHHPQGPLALIRLLFSSDCDVLHLHVGGEITTRVLALVFVCSLFRRGRNILSFHSGGYPQTAEGRAAKPGSFRGLLFRRFARIIAVNPVIAEVFERYGVAPEKLRVIQPFVPKSPDKNVEVPKALGAFAVASKPFLLTVCLLEDEYDLFMQIDAMEYALQRFPDAGLMIVGSGSLKDHLDAAIAAKPYRARIMLTGDVEHPVTLHLINDADILLRTTLFDGDAIAVREALFLDTPVIATDNGMRPEGVHLIPMHDAKALVNRIADLAGTQLTPKKPKTPDTSNIEAILAVYKGLMAV